MENADSYESSIEGEVRKKQEKAEKLAAQLRQRASILRQFAEKYRNNSAEQLRGFNNAELDKED